MKLKVWCLGWGILKQSLCHQVHSIFQILKEVAGTNGTLLSLISKVETPIMVNDITPISLCNVSYKIITKVPANRLKGLMNCLVSPQ